MKLTQLFLCSAALALPLTLLAAQENNDRWFEVEIILFSQLGDKSQLKESFPDTSELPKHRRVEDLLSKHLYPDIRDLKQLLPRCDSPQTKQSLLRKNIFNEKSLTELSITTSESVLAKLFTEQSNTGEDLQADLSVDERVKIQRLVLAADEEFQNFKFQYTAKTEPKLLCRIDESYFVDYKINNPYFDYNNSPVDKMPLLIDAQEAAYNNKTHLLSKDSLQLDDVIKDLRYSKNFRPVLHMGWRQVARPAKQSVPVKIYAGENFAADQQKQLVRFNAEKSQQTAALPIPNQAEHIQRQKQARIEQIIAQISQVNENSDELLASLDQQNLSLTLANQNALTPASKTPPAVPVQQWFIEGFFNIHLKHYLFITADFNVLDKNLSELATAQLAASSATNINANASKPIQAKAIRFKQNRRVISGEVHYFDHPYMGMIVQIRPYEPKESH